MLQCPTCGRRYSDDLQTCPEDGSLLQADVTVAEPIPPDPMVGRTFDEKYRLDERLGVGGMGTVYRATHLLIDRPVAVKVLNPRFVEDEAAKQRFRREARAAGRLRHSNAVAVTDFGQTSDGFTYIVMELLEGKTLRDILARDAPLDTARAVSIMLQVSAAVAAAHEAGVIHRDLKPANIFIVQRRHVPPIVKVLDFGIAKLAADSVDESDPQTLTQMGVMIGTPRYMSPEQCDGKSLTPASDVYSLGIILYEMLTGMTPFTGLTPLSIALKHSSEIPRRPRELVPSIPETLEQVILHALEKRPEFRPADAGEFRRELYEVAERLGLEHAASLSAPTLETVRSIGTETPSGRLVLDIERLRQSRATATNRPSETTLLSSSAERHATSTARDLRKTSSTPFGAARETRPEISKLTIFTSRKQAVLNWLKQPLGLMTVSLVALFLIVMIIGIVIAYRSSGSASGSNQAETVASPSDNSANTAKSSSNSAETNENSESSGHHENRQQRRQTTPRPQKRESKAKRIIKKLWPF
ncbi:MAG: hypothetical protein AUG51_04480 [Acidobacteria bacterium 13_1_20CM_3_53_8]|nr:MAG: hypothetical protein AUG51_04480 [Acidobacteria bacterium 13_1_20CM_3_53_8]